MSTSSSPVRVSCLSLSADVIAQRRALTKEAAAILTKQYAGTSKAYVGEMLPWHECFPVRFSGELAKLPLYEVAAYLQQRFTKTDIYGFIDYCYMADCLRETLADYVDPRDARRLRRALAWVKQAGAARYAAEQVEGGNE